MFDFDLDLDMPNTVVQVPVAVAPFGNAASIGQLNFADGSNGLSFDNAAGIGQFDLFV